MKINSIGIDAYRQAAERSQVENRPAAQKQSEVEKASRVHIPGHLNKAGSKLGVKLPEGSFVDMLSTEEKKAFEMVFERFRQLSTADGAYNENGAGKRQAVGNFVDVTL